MKLLEHPHAKENNHKSLSELNYLKAQIQETTKTSEAALALSSRDVFNIDKDFDNKLQERDT